MKKCRKRTEFAILSELLRILMSQKYEAILMKISLNKDYFSKEADKIKMFKKKNRKLCVFFVQTFIFSYYTLDNKTDYIFS